MHFIEAIPSKITGERILVRHVPLKRLFDIAFSFAVLLILAPLFILIGLWVKLSSKGPVIYGHERVGRGGTTFKCYKFRTMYVDAEAKLAELLKSDPALKKEWNTYYKLKNDPRVTRIGRLLRKTSLDELPQFWNVLKGDLSVVGPRPVTKEELINEYGPYRSRLLSIRPGVTGPWQVSGRNNLTYADRIKLDMRYINHSSLVWDIKLIFRTIPAMILTRGAY